MGKEIKFHPATFYLGIGDMLAREVEGQNQDEVDRKSSHEDGEIEKPKAGLGVELEEHPGKTSMGEEHTATSPRPSKPDLIPPLSEERA